MGQGNSKTSKDASTKDKRGGQQAAQQPSSGTARDAAGVSISPPTFLNKVNKMFGSRPDLAEEAITAVNKCPPASPLPPSSSSLAQAFRQELGGASPAQKKKDNSSFFLGKMLISPRRPLREYESSRVSSSSIAESSSIASLADKPAMFVLPTPKSLKRKLSSTANVRTKMMRREPAASPVLKKNPFPAGRTPDVEEQDDDDCISPDETNGDPGDEKNEGQASNRDGSEEQLEQVMETTVSLTNSPSKISVTQQNEDVASSNESTMTAPYSPSQQPKGLVSAMDISLSSMMSCTSPAATTIIHKLSNSDGDLSHDDMSDSSIDTLKDDSQNNSVIENVKSTADTVPQQEATETSLPSVSMSASQDTCITSDQSESGGADSIAAANDNAVDMNGFSDSEENVNPRADADASRSSVRVVMEAAPAASEALPSYEEKTADSTRLEDMDINTLPRACTTDCPSISKKMLSSEYTVTQSKKEDKDKSTSDHSKSLNDVSASTNGEEDVNKSVEKPPRASQPDDAFYHHPLALSTFSSSMSKMKWPSFSMISTSSVSSIPVPSFSFINSLLGIESTTASAGAKSSVNDDENSLERTENVPSCEMDDVSSEDAVTPNDDRSTPVKETIQEEGSLKLTENSRESSAASKENESSSPTSTIATSSSAVATTNSSTPPGAATETSASKLLTLEQPHTPKRSRRIANLKAVASTTKSGSVDSPGATTASDESRRRKRRSSSSDSDQSSSSDLVHGTPAKPSSQSVKKVKLNSGEASTADHQQSSGKVAKVMLVKQVLNNTKESTDDNDDHDDVESNSMDTSETPSNGATPVGDPEDEDGNMSDVSCSQSTSSCTSVVTGSKPTNKKLAALYEKVAVLRDDNTARYIANSQVLLLVQPLPNSNSSGPLVRQLRQRFTQCSFVSKLQEQQGKKNKRSHSDTMCKLERYIREGQSPILLELGRAAASAAPYLQLAYSANYNTVLLHESLYAVFGQKQKKKAQLSLPFCYSWFLNVTDSVELSMKGRQLLHRLLELPAFSRDLRARTGHSGTDTELVSSYIANNVVGGPEVLHCTAKGGASSDPAYCTQPSVLEAMGVATSLAIVGFVVTPRTFGARVRLTEEQKQLWGNSDSPAVPKDISDLFAKQRKIPSAFDAEVDRDGEEKSYSAGNAEQKLAKVQGYNKNQMTLKCVPQNSEEFCPTSGVGSRAHITLGCFTREVHPRTTGYDLLLAIEKETKAAIKKDSGAAAQDTNGRSSTMERTTVEESDSAESDQELVEGDSALDTMSSSDSAPAKGDDMTDDVQVKEAATNGKLSDDDEQISAALKTVATSDGPNTDAITNIVFGPSDEEEEVTAAGREVLESYCIEGATVRCYGDGVWVVYPHQQLQVTAMFSGYHND